MISSNSYDATHNINDEIVDITQTAVIQKVLSSSVSSLEKDNYSNFFSRLFSSVNTKPSTIVVTEPNPLCLFLKEDKVESMATISSAKPLNVSCQNPGEFPFQRLPLICKEKVLAFLGEKEKLKGLEVCKEWGIIKSSSFWRHVNLTEFCVSESKLSSFVNFLESFNCRLKSIKLNYNDLKRNLSLNVFLESKIVSELESVTLDWGTIQNDDKPSCLTLSNGDKISHNRRQQRRFKEFFSNICQNLPHIIHLNTIFDWTLPSITNLQKLTSLKSLTLNKFPSIITQFDQNLFTGLMQSLTSLESLNIERVGMAVSSYEKLKFNSSSLKRLDLSRSEGIILSEAHLPFLNQLILPSKHTKNDNFDTHNINAKIMNNGSVNVADANDRIKLNAAKIHLKAESLITQNENLNVPNCNINKNISLVEKYSDINNDKLINNLNSDNTINKVLITPVDGNTNHIDDKYVHDDNQIIIDNDNNIMHKIDNTNINIYKKSTSEYRCMSKVLDEGCPCLLEVNGFQLSDLKNNLKNINANNNNKDNNNIKDNINIQFFGNYEGDINGGGICDEEDRMGGYGEEYNSEYSIDENAIIVKEDINSQVFTDVLNFGNKTDHPEDIGFNLDKNIIISLNNTNNSNVICNNANNNGETDCSDDYKNLQAEIIDFSKHGSSFICDGSDLVYINLANSKSINKFNMIKTRDSTPNNINEIKDQIIVINKNVGNLDKESKNCYLKSYCPSSHK